MKKPNKPRIPETIGGHDVDELFSYRTVKIVKVKDCYLGVIYRLFLLGILGYVLYVIFGQKRYLDLEQPVGNVRVSLKAPSHAIFPSNYSFCSQSPQATNGTTNCVVWDEYQAVFPPDSTSAIFITTRVTQSDQIAQCVTLKGRQGCKTPWNTTQTELFFLAGLEDYTIMVSHAFQARKFYLASGQNPQYSGTGQNIAGTSLDSHGDVYRRSPPGSTDIFAVSEILGLSASNLDAISDSPTANDNETFRGSGMVLVWTINYDNINTKSGNVEYTYSVARILNTEYKVVETVPMNRTTRLTNDRHGIKILFLQTGSIGRFSFQTLLIQLVASLGLLSVATVVTDSLMAYVMPRRKEYLEYKYEQTKDFSDDRSAHKKKGDKDGPEDGKAVDNPPQTAQGEGEGGVDPEAGKNNAVGGHNEEQPLFNGEKNDASGQQSHGKHYKVRN